MTPKRSLEREEKWDVPATFVPPELIPDLPEGATVSIAQVHLSSTYFDTDRHDLLNADVSLRRRTGDTDTGWQAKLASRTEHRIEITQPLQPSSVDENVTPPESIGEILAGLGRGRTLRPIAIVRTARTLHSVHDATGTLLLELADDTVHSTAIGPTASIQAWREVEVELKQGSPKLLRRLGKQLQRAGAMPRPGSSKLTRTLELDDAVPPPIAAPIARYLHEQYLALLAGDLDLRMGNDAVHPTRVACRRLRSTLRNFAPLLADDGATGDADVDADLDADLDFDLDTEIAWYAALLGDARDAQVMRAHFRQALGDVPVELTLGAVAARIATSIDQWERDALAVLGEAMHSPRYFALLDAVEAFVEHQAAAKPPKRKQIEKLVAQAEQKYQKRLRRALRSPKDDAALHRARKAAKRARYAYEATELDGARRRIRDFKRLQTTLGEFQDAVVAKELLRKWGAATSALPDENGFTFGLLWQREDENQRRIRRALRHAG
ncbi:CHAD domain-containing protein [Frankineae bacterium MT45]|nr:CHAD domain-containing protein [Frankineae bacterium MT45]